MLDVSALSKPSTILQADFLKPFGKAFNHLNISIIMHPLILARHAQYSCANLIVNLGPGYILSPEGNDQASAMGLRVISFLPSSYRAISLFCYDEPVCNQTAELVRARLKVRSNKIQDVQPGLLEAELEHSPTMIIASAEQITPLVEHFASAYGCFTDIGYPPRGGGFLFAKNGILRLI